MIELSEWGVKMKIKVEMSLDIADEAFDELKKIEHHVDYFLNLDEYPEIRSVYGVSVTKEQGTEENESR